MWPRPGNDNSELNIEHAAYPKLTPETTIVQRVFSRFFDKTKVTLLLSRVDRETVAFLCVRRKNAVHIDCNLIISHGMST